jgi:hypothetical protein
MDQSTLGRDGIPYVGLTQAVVDDERVSKLGLLVYMALCRFAKYNTRVAWPGKDRIAACARISKRAVYQGLKNLIETEWLSVKTFRTKTGRRNGYTLHDDANNPRTKEKTWPLGGEANTAQPPEGDEATFAEWVRQYVPNN